MTPKQLCYLKVSLNAIAVWGIVQLFEGVWVWGSEKHIYGEFAFLLLILMFVLARYSYYIGRYGRFNPKNQANWTGFDLLLILPAFVIGMSCFLFAKYVLGFSLVQINIVFVGVYLLMANGYAYYGRRRKAGEECKTV